MFAKPCGQAGAARDVTFNLKDFRHMLALAEGLGCDVALYLEKCGSPLVVLPVPQGNDAKVGASPCRRAPSPRPGPRLLSV